LGTRGCSFYYFPAAAFTDGAILSRHAARISGGWIPRKATLGVQS
jgi:hypothetical protein